MRKCITLSDLMPGADPDAPGETILRETFNMLLRYFGELKHMNFRYRDKALQPKQDPFVLSALQLWVLCRDMDCITPHVSLAVVNRTICTGERFVLEAIPSALAARLALHLEVKDPAPDDPRAAASPSRASQAKSTQSTTVARLEKSKTAGSASPATVAPAN